ncbi:MAG: hypothetical protein ACLFTH_04165 [Candidatus Woesearchaeota archaeon]
MNVLGNIERFKERLKEEFDKNLKEIEKQHENELKHITEDYNIKQQEREEEYKRLEDEETRRIVAEETSKADAVVERNHSQAIEEAMGEVIEDAKRKLTTSRTGYTLTTNKRYLKRLKEILEKVKDPVITAHTSTFSAKLHKTVKTSKKQTGVVIETKNVIYDYTLETFVRENEDELRQLIETRSRKKK